MYYHFNIDYTFVKNSDVRRGDIMKYIKNYYDIDDYTSILNHFFKIFINDNFINISEYEYKSIFNDIIHKISIDIINNNIKSDKKLFDVVRENITARQVVGHYGVRVNRNGMACCPFRCLSR